MKLNKKKSFLFSVLILLLFSNTFCKESNITIEDNETNQIQIKESGVWNLMGISIDDNNPIKNWSYTALHYDWCSGSGNWTNPYIIENVTIDGHAIDNCIEIANSDTYFIIRKCFLYNASSNDACISFSNVENGKIIENNCSDNRNYGIYLYESANNTISGNNAIRNKAGIVLRSSPNNTLSGNNVSINGVGVYVSYGILLDSCENSTIAGNSANNNDYGIFIGGSVNNTVSGNTANDNSNNGIYMISSIKNTISGNTINNNDYGIYISGGANNTYSGNTASYNNKYGIFIIGSANNTFSSNLMSFCGIFLECSLGELESHIIDDTNLVNNRPVYYYTNEIGLGLSDFTNAGQIFLINSNNSLIYGNNLSNGNDAIYFYNSNNNMLLGNIVNGNTRGIHLDKSDNNTILGNIIRYNNDYGIFLYDCENNTITENSIDNSEYGIDLDGSYNNILLGNIITINTRGIHLDKSDNNTILGNNISYNNDNGINLNNCINNTITENSIDNNDYGISLGSISDNNIITGNFVSNSIYGIYLDGSFNNIVTGNTASSNDYGILLFTSFNNTVLENTANNNDYGITLWHSDTNTVSENNINYNNDYGINFLYSDTNTVSENNINYNHNYGIIMASYSTNNKIFLNYFINNGINAEDNGIINMWDSGSIGNYWDDYVGVDANHDNIGDTLYLIPGTAGSQDNFPIYDGVAPIITIIFPLPNSLFGLDSPNYNITIDELNLDTVWYTIDGTLKKYIITSLTGTLNQTVWESLSEGIHTISFYANDSSGNIAQVDVQVIIEFSGAPNSPLIPFGNYYLLFSFIVIISFIIMVKKKIK